MIRASAVSGPAVAAAVLSLILLGGCKHEEKKTDTKTYEPPKLRSESERASTSRVETKQATGERPALRMSRSQVEAVQGKPDRVDVFSYPGSSESIEDWRYAEIENGCRLVQFTNGKVTMLRECIGAGNASSASSP